MAGKLCMDERRQRLPAREAVQGNEAMMPLPSKDTWSRAADAATLTLRGGLARKGSVLIPRLRVSSKNCIQPPQVASTASAWGTTASLGSRVPARRQAATIYVRIGR